MSIGLALALSSAQAVTGAPAQGNDEAVTYVVKAGDTFDRLSRNYLVPERNWQALLRLSGILDPKRLPVGHRLVIPRSWLRYKLEPARLASYRGTVRIALDDRLLTPTVGMPVAEGMRLTTAGNSFLSLVLADRSIVVIPSQTQVAIHRLRRQHKPGTA